MTELNSSNPVVTLREVVETDLPIFYTHQLDPEGARMVGFPSRDWDAHVAHWRKIMGIPSTILRTILVDGEVAGNLLSFEHDGWREVGYWLGREFWGRGIASQALAQFLEVVKTRPLYGVVVKHNRASLRVLQKCGFVLLPEDHSTSDAPGDPATEFTLVLSA
jgi:RimJ/RimL family protein N-acetyltransferase